MSEQIQIGRIDMLQVPDGVRVMKWPLDWAPGTPPVVNYLNQEMSILEMTAFLESKGWIIRRWPTGARAWKDKLRPIRTRSQIWRKREQYSRHPLPNMELHAVDFAFDY